MKKIISLLLASVMLLSLCACGKEDTTDKPDTAETLSTSTESTDVVLNGIEEAFPENTVVKAEIVSEGDKFTTADTALKEIAAKFRLYNITAISDNVAVQPNGTVKATFDIPTGYDTDKVAVVYISDNGKLETLASTVDTKSNTVTANLSHFSLYAVIETAKIDNTENNATESTDNTSKPEITTDSNSSKSSKPDSSGEPSESDEPVESDEPIESSKPTVSTNTSSVTKPIKTECKHNVKYSFNNKANTWTHTGQCTLCKKYFNKNAACTDKNKDNKCDNCSAKMDFGTAYKNVGFVIEWIGLEFTDTRYDKTPTLTAETVFMETKFKTKEKDVKFTEFSETYIYNASDFEKMAKSLFNIDNAKIAEMRALKQLSGGKTVSVYDSSTKTYRYSQGAFGGGAGPDYLGYKKLSDTKYAVYINDSSYDYVKVINCTYTDTVKISNIYAINTAPSGIIKFN